MSPTEAAEAIERARLELLRQGTWDGLRDAERATRIEVSLKALERSGITAEMASLAERATASETAASRAIARAERAEARATEAEARLEVELAEVRARHDAEVAAAETRATEAEGLVAEARARAEAAEQRAAAAETRAEAHAAEAEAALAALATERHGSTERPASTPTDTAHPGRRRMRTPWGARPTPHEATAG